MTEDISAFFSVTEFARAVTLNGVTVSAIFDNDYALAAVGDFGMAGSAPVLTLASAAVPADWLGAAVVVNGKNFAVTEHKPDGTGISLLILVAAP
jgi:hypothetical protein